MVISPAKMVISPVKMMISPAKMMIYPAKMMIYPVKMMIYLANMIKHGDFIHEDADLIKNVDWTFKHGDISSKHVIWNNMLNW